MTLKYYDCINYNCIAKSRVFFPIVVLVLLGISLHTLATGKVAAKNQQPYLLVSPERCVALRQGQICYQEIQFSWRVLSKDRYCLYDEQIDKPLTCWSGKTEGKFEMDFQAPSSRAYVLRNEDRNFVVANTKFVVAWVYGNKKRRRSSWRLF